MNVMDAARALGLVAADREVTGTVDEDRVLGALAELTDGDPANADLFDAVADSVRRARSAGLEVQHASRMSSRPSQAATTTQLRYRSEMADLFTDLAIDVGLRHHRKLAVAA